MRILITFLVAVFMIANPLPASDMPEWVVNPYSVYDQSLYIAATGTGSSRAAAEEDAISSIAAVFGVNVESETSIYTHDNTVSGAFDSMTSSSSLSVSAKLSGVTITEHWSDGKSEYALAVMDKNSASSYYLSEIVCLSNGIDEKIETARETGDMLSLYIAAYSQLPDAREVDRCISILAVLSPGSMPSEARGEAYVESVVMSAAREISIVIELVSKSGLEDSLYFALVGCLTSNGILVIKPEDARYILNAGIDVYETPAPRGMVYAEYDLTLDLIDIDTDKEILAYSYSGREGHRTLERAERMVENTISKLIDKEFGKRFLSVF